MATYAGKTLKSVTEGQPPTKPSAPQSGLQQSRSQSGSGGSSGGSKRVSRTPIIVIPSAENKSLISMFNAREVLQDLKFVPSEEKRATGKEAFRSFFFFKFDN